MRCLCAGRNATGSVGRTIHRDIRTKLGIHYAFHSPSSCMLPLQRLMRRNKLDRRVVGSHMHSVLQMGFLIKLFSAPCRASLGKTSRRMRGRRGRVMTLRTSHRSVMLLGGSGGTLPLSMTSVEGVTIYNPGTSRATCTLARCKPLTISIAAILDNVHRGMSKGTRILCAGNYRLMSTG